DLKPANVFLRDGGGEGAVKIGDFGISRFGAPTEADDVADPTEPDAHADTAVPPAGERPKPARLTATGALIGTYPYMAPELLVARATAASDVFAFGVLAWEIVSGQQPFTEPPLGRAARGAPFERPSG